MIYYIENNFLQFFILSIAFVNLSKKIEIQIKFI